LLHIGVIWTQVKPKLPEPVSVDSDLVIVGDFGFGLTQELAGVEDDDDEKIIQRVGLAPKWALRKSERI
jgi:hypothetical protein